MTEQQVLQTLWWSVSRKHARAIAPIAAHFIKVGDNVGLPFMFSIYGPWYRANRTLIVSSDPELWPAFEDAVRKQCKINLYIMNKHRQPLTATEPYQ